LLAENNGGRFKTKSENLFGKKPMCIQKPSPCQERAYRTQGETMDLRRIKLVEPVSSQLMLDHGRVCKVGPLPSGKWRS